MASGPKGTRNFSPRLEELGVKAEGLAQLESGAEKGPHVPQPEPPRAFWEGAAPAKRGPERALPGGWEAQRQPFLEAAPSPSAGQGKPAPLTSGWRALPQADFSPSKAASDMDPQPCGEAVAQLLPGLAQEAPQSPLAKEESSCGLVEEEGAPDAERVRWRFRLFRYEEAGGPREVCVRLRELCRQWLQPEKHSPEQIVELLVLEQFLSVLPPQIQPRVREGSPQSCGQAVALAEQFLPQPHRGKDGWEGQVSEGLQAGNTPSSDPDAPLESWQAALSQETKEEQGRDAGHGRCGEDETSQPENSRELQPYWMMSGKAEPGFSHCSDAGVASGSRQGSSSSDQGGDALAHFKPVDQELKDQVAQQRISKGGREKTCVECGQAFQWRAELVAHKRTHTGEKLYECLDCGRSFSYKSRLIAHKKMHTGEKPYKCPDCGKSFSRQPHLIAHERVHTGEKPYVCPECGRSFSDRSNLNTHKRTHTGEKPYRCSHCGKSFSQSSTCMKHERIHTGEKPYKCAMCSKSFCQRSQLINHERIHTGEKPYKCSVCGKEFSRRTDLVTHQRRHTGKKPHKCLACGQSFSVGSSLNEHNRTHTGEKAHQCSRSSQPFAHFSDCVKHEQTHTQE